MNTSDSAHQFSVKLSLFKCMHVAIVAACSGSPPQCSTFSSIYILLDGNIDNLYSLLLDGNIDNLYSLSAQRSETKPSISSVVGLAHSGSELFKLAMPKALIIG